MPASNVFAAATDPMYADAVPGVPMPGGGGGGGGTAQDYGVPPMDSRLQEDYTDELNEVTDAMATTAQAAATAAQTAQPPESKGGNGTLFLVLGALAAGFLLFKK